MPNKVKSSYMDGQDTKVEKKVKTIGGRTKVKIKQTISSPQGSRTTTAKTVRKNGSVWKASAKVTRKSPESKGGEKTYKEVQRTTPSGSVKKKQKFYGPGGWKEKSAGNLDKITVFKNTKSI